MRNTGTFLMLLTIVATPNIARACACGCGVFGVGSTFMLPDEDQNGMVFFQYNFMNQNQNWSGTYAAPAANNSDKDIETSFYNIGFQYMFNQDWGVMVEIPYWERSFTTTIDAAGDIGTFDHGALGDVRILGFYTGFSCDRSTGVIFGFKLPTGDHTYPNFDPDTEIGTGSTDVILGAYHVGKFAEHEQWQWFMEGTWEAAFATTSGYRPGDEIDGAIGLYYNAGRVGCAQKISPVLQALCSLREPDTGVNADPLNTGYARLILSPGVEVDFDHVKFYGDAEFPVLQSYNGNQLVAPVLVKAVVAYTF